MKMTRLENGGFILREIELYVYLAMDKLEEKHITLLSSKANTMAQNIDKVLRG